MFTKESLYINAIKYDTQLKVEYKKISNSDIVETNNSTFIVSEDIMPLDISLKINSKTQDIESSYISTLLLSDNTQLVPKDKSSKLKDCELANFNSFYDIAVLKSTLFETKNFFQKTGVDYIFSAFHIINLYLEKYLCQDELLIFLYDKKAYILITNDNGSIVFHKIEDLPSFESVKKSHFYESEIEGQTLFNEIYYLELSQIINKTLNSFYEQKTNQFIQKVKILYSLKQLTNEEIIQLSQDTLLKIEHIPINVDESIFELSNHKNQLKSFIKPRKKNKKSNFSYIIILFLLLAGFFALFKFYTHINEEKKTSDTKKVTSIKLPNHINTNNIILNRLEKLLNGIPNDVILEDLNIQKDTLKLNAKLLKTTTFHESLEPLLNKFYENTTLKILTKDKKFNLKVNTISQKELPLEKKSKNEMQKYIIDEFMPISRVTEQLKILMPDDTIIKFKSSNNEKITKYYYRINILTKTPIEFFSLIQMLNKELYSINIDYPIDMIQTADGLEIEFNLIFNQIRKY